jgi:phosphomannomutase
VRPSGTEPKLKCYLEAVGKAADEAAKDLEGIEKGIREMLNVLESST